MGEVCGYIFYLCSRQLLMTGHLVTSWPTDRMGLWEGRTQDVVQES